MVSRKLAITTATGVVIATSATCHASPLSVLVRAAREAMRSQGKEGKPPPVTERTQQAVGGQRAAENIGATELIGLTVAGGLLLLAFWGMHKLHERKSRRSEDSQESGDL